MAVRWKGGWSGSGSPVTSLITYYNGDSVFYENISYTVQANILSIPIGSPPPPSDMTKWDVLVAGGSDGTSGSSGTSGLSGSSGTSGYGVPLGGTSGQVLSKIDGTNYNTQWVNQTGGAGGSI